MRFLLIAIISIIAYNIFIPQNSQEQYEKAFFEENIHSLTIDDSWNLENLQLNSPIDQHAIFGKPITSELNILLNAYLHTISYRLPDMDTTLTLTYQKNAFNQANFNQYYLTAYQIDHLDHIQFSNGLHANQSIEDTISVLKNHQYQYQIADNMIGIKANGKNIILGYEANQLKSIIVKEYKIQI